jgi:preprotein translocase subunit SecG
LLSWIAGFERKPTSIIHTGGAPAQETPGAPPVAPPISGGGGGLDLLKKGPGGGNTAPAPGPSGPQVPQSQ